MKKKVIPIALVLLASVTVYQHFQISGLEESIEVMKERRSLVAKAMESNHPKVAFIDIKSTLENYKEIDPEGEQVFGLLDKAVETYNKHNYIVLDRDMLIGKPQWAKTISLEITEDK
jgi:hypothetical protein